MHYKTFFLQFKYFVFCLKAFRILLIQENFCLTLNTWLNLTDLKSWNGGSWYTGNINTEDIPCKWNPNFKRKWNHETNENNWIRVELSCQDLYMWFNCILYSNRVAKCCIRSQILFLERAECNTENFNIHLPHVKGDSNANLRKAFCEINLFIKSLNCGWVLKIS